MDLDSYFKENKSDVEDLLDVPEGFKSGFVTFVGRPNSGKSTLLNALVGKKVAITSKVANTTRHRFSGVINRVDCQIIIVDTPGIHKPRDVMGEELNLAAYQALQDSDVVCFLVDSTRPFGRGDAWVLEEVKKSSAHKFCLLTKTDIATDEQILLQIKHLSETFDFEEIVPISAVGKTNIDLLIDLIKDRIPEGHRWFSSDETSDVDDYVYAAEVVREQILHDLKDELPHSIGVVTDDIYESSNGKTLNIYSTIYVERDSQIGIVVGKAGSQLKRIGKNARIELESYFDKNINLQLSVKLKKNWRRDDNAIRKFGYCQ